MQISVIVPTYKPGAYVWDCLESLYCQTLSKDKFEVIIILNGCQGPWSVQILEWIQHHSDLNVTFLSSIAPGVSKARNIGLKHSKGEYITFIDDDDFISKTYLEELLKVAEENPRSVVLSNTIAYDERIDEYNSNYFLKKIFDKLNAKSTPITLLASRSLFNGPCMKLLPKEILWDTQFDESFSYNEDSLYMYEISKNITNIKTSPATAVYYRRFRSDSAITSKKKVKDLIRNQIRFNRKVLHRYVHDFPKYNLTFTLSRLLASIKFVVMQFKGN